MDLQEDLKRVVLSTASGAMGGSGRLATALAMFQVIQVSAADEPAPISRPREHWHAKRLRLYEDARIIRGQTGFIADIIFPRATHHDRGWIKNVKRQFIGYVCEDWSSFILEYRKQDHVHFLSGSAVVSQHGFQSTSKLR